MIAVTPTSRTSAEEVATSGEKIEAMRTLTRIAGHLPLAPFTQTFKAAGRNRLAIIWLVPLYSLEEDNAYGGYNTGKRPNKTTRPLQADRYCRLRCAQ